MKFDQSKSLLFVTEDAKFNSSKYGILTVKPGQTKTVNQLFENVAEQALVSNDGMFLYLNKDNKLATANFADAEGKENNTAVNSDDQNNQNQNQTSTDSSSTQSSVPTEEEARQRLDASFPDGGTYGGESIDALVAVRGEKERMDVRW